MLRLRISGMLPGLISKPLVTFYPYSYYPTAIREDVAITSLDIVRTVS
jgi:hypothetical protein